MESASAQAESNQINWEVDLTPGYCPHCHSVLLLPPGAHSLCPVCHSASWEPDPDGLDQYTPELMLDYSLEANMMTSHLHEWTRGVWLRPEDFSVDHLVSRIHRVLIPMWLVDGAVTAGWQAQVGFNYQVLSSTDTFHQGQWSSQPVTETRLRWEARAGFLHKAYMNLAVPAMDQHQSLMDGLGQYNLKEAVAYQPTMIHGSSVLLPGNNPQRTWPLAKDSFDRAAIQDCQIASGAQQIDQVKLEADYSSLKWTLLLLPSYTTYYSDDQGAIHPVWIHGRTGQIYGLRKASQVLGWRWTGVLAGIGLACLLFSVLISLLIPALPFISIFSTVIFIMGILITLTSPIPAIWAWQFNRSSQA